MGAGRPRNMDNPQTLLKYWDEYKMFVDSNPDSEEVVTVKGDIVTRKMNKPYLKVGFESFVFRTYGVSIKDYLLGKYEEFSDVVTCIRSEWEENQISGSLTGKYKAPNLVARLNGLTEKQETKVEGGLEIKIKRA